MLLYRKQEGDREIVTTMGPAWFMVQSLFFSRGGLLGVFSVAEDGDHRNNNDDDCDGSTNLSLNPKWLSLPFGMTVSGFWISAEILLFLSPWPCQQIRGSMETTTSILFSQDTMVSSPSLP